MDLTAADIAVPTAALNTIRITLGDKSRTFCEQAVAGISSNSGSMPADLEVAGLEQDLEDFTKLDAFYANYLALGEKIDDTLRAVSSDVMTGPIIGRSKPKAKTSAP